MHYRQKEYVRLLAPKYNYKKIILYKSKNEVALPLLPIHPGLALFPCVDLRRQVYSCTRGCGAILL